MTEASMAASFKGSEGIWHRESDVGFYLRVLQTEEIEYSVQTYAGNGLLRIGLDLGFCVVGDSQTGQTQHRQVIRSVADGHRLLEIYMLDLTKQPEEFSLAASVHYLTRTASGQLAVLNLTLIRISVLETELLLTLTSEAGAAC